MKSDEAFAKTVLKWVDDMRAKGVSAKRIDYLTDVWDKVSRNRVTKSDAHWILQLVMGLYCTATHEVDDDENEGEWEVTLLQMIRLAGAVEYLTEQRLKKRKK